MRRARISLMSFITRTLSLHRWSPFRRITLIALVSLCAVLSTGSNSFSARAQQTEVSPEQEIEKGLALMLRRQYEEALKSFKRANDLRGKNSTECLFLMAKAYNGLEAYKNVVQTCDRVIELAANDADLQAQAYNLKGIALQSQADIKDAKKLQEAEA